MLLARALAARHAGAGVGAAGRSLLLARRLPASAGRAALRGFASVPPPSPGNAGDAPGSSEGVHGQIDPASVRSKAMRARLIKGQRKATAASTSAREEAEPPAEPQPPVLPPPSYESEGPYRESFASMLFRNLVAGVGVALGVTLISLVFRFLFGGGQRHTHPPAQAGRGQPPSQLLPPLQRGSGSGSAAPDADEALDRWQESLEREDEAAGGDPDPYSVRNSMGVAGGSGGGRRGTSL